MRVPNTGASDPLEFGTYHPPGAWMCSPAQKLSKPHRLRVLWGSTMMARWIKSLATVIDPISSPPVLPGHLVAVGRGGGGRVVVGG